MKLLNKETGKVYTVEITADNLEVEPSTLAEFVDEWEDVPYIDESKKFKKWVKNGIKSELLGTLVAPEDYVAPNDKRYFTYDEAMELEEKVLKPNGWRLPTYKDLLLLLVEFGIDEETGLDDPDKFEKTLKMEKMGWIPDGSMGDYNDNPKDDDLAYDRGVYGNWWTSTISSGTNARYLTTNSTRLIPQNSYARGNGFTVRCVAR